jgi:hypothetical protein
MINLVNNAVAQYGAAPVIAGAFVVGLISIPLLEKIAAIAERILMGVRQFCEEQIFLVRMRSMGCPICAEVHRSHIQGAHAT